MSVLVSVTARSREVTSLKGCALGRDRNQTVTTLTFNTRRRVDVHGVLLGGRSTKSALRYWIYGLTLVVASCEGRMVFAQETRTGRASVNQGAFRLPSEVVVPVGNQLTSDRIELGKLLFFDPRLSSSNWISCASCHNPSLGWSDGLAIGVGDGMRRLARKTPSIVNSGYNSFQMWDGRAKSLEEQAWSPMLSSAEMHGTLEQILLKLRAISGYITRFNKAYPDQGITSDTVAEAIASFERTVVSRDSPFDQWEEGDESAMTTSAKRGFTLFIGKANCVACHRGGNFTDQGFHNLGLRGNTDPGRYAIVPIHVLRGAFKTPSLRDVALTAPYMHDGSYRTLEEVIDHYNRGGDDKENLDPNIKPLGLTEREKRDLVEFLKSLTGKQMMITLPRLPPS
jgi:cytochrome c peroxidase